MATKKQMQATVKMAISLSDKNENLAVELGVDLKRTISDLSASIIQKSNLSARLIVEVGLELKAALDQLEHGEYTDFYASIGLPKERASEFIRYADFVSALPQAQRKHVIELPKKKVLLLASADQEVVADMLANPETADEITTMSRDELRDYVRSLETKNANLNQQLEIEHVKQKQLVSQRKNNLYPDFVEMARHESTALADKAMLCVDDLARLRHELDAISSMPSHEAGFTRFLHIAQSALFHNLRAAAGRFNALLNELQNEFDETVTGPVDPVNYFTDDDIRLAVAERNLLVSDHKHEAVMREDERSLKKSQKSRKAGKGK